MHMADALLSPSVGGALWAATAGVTAYCSRVVREEMDDRKVPLMGVLGAFVFAAQMINFTIPGTGSSGHLGGGLLLAILLGPHAAFLVLSSVLVVQALFFADGGLLALGANVFNLGVFPCFVAYPLVYRPLAGRGRSRGLVAAAAVLAATVGLQFGALGVVLETVLSGVSELPFHSFLLLMLPIHLAIGVVEGLVTAAVVSFVARTQPGVLAGPQARGGPGLRRVVAGFALVALLLGGGLSWLASSKPDGLEWAISRVAGPAGVAPPGGGGPDAGVHGTLGRVQERVAVLPDYSLPGRAPASEGGEEGEGSEGWPSPDAGAGVSGIVGGLLTLAAAGAVGLALRRRGRAT